MNDESTFEPELISVLNDFTKEAESFVKKFETFRAFVVYLSP